MISLMELLNSIKDEETDGMILVDDWRWPDVDHLINMGFELTDDYRLQTNKEPKIIVYRKKENVDVDGKSTRESYFFIEDGKRKTKKFKNFNDVIDYFDTYVQPEIDKNN